MRVSKRSRKKVLSSRQKLALAITLGLLFIGEVLLGIASKKELRLPDRRHFALFWDQRLSEIREQYLEIFEYRNHLKKFLPHPYWGYQYNCLFVTGPCNNYGLLDERDFPYAKNERDFVVGIFGGSVAQQVAQYVKKDEEWQQRFRELSGLDYPYLVILNFAMGGSKQPQQYALANYFMEGLDYAINIDGYNEVIYNNHLIFPLEFPWLSDYLYTSTAGKERLNEAWSLARIRNFYAAPLRRIEPLKYSAFVLFFLEKLDRLFKAQYERLFVLREDLPPEHKGHPFYPQGISEEEEFVTLADIWSRYTRMQDHLLNQAKIKHAFFLQPNQYVPNSLPNLGPEQLEKIIDPRTSKTLPIKYAHLQKQLGQLHQQGIPVHDLTNVFRHSKEDVYSDKCCHLSEAGTKILADKILEVIEHTWQSPRPAAPTEEAVPSSVFFYDRRKK